MDKTHNISLGGFAFQIDDAAFRILNKYLSDVRMSLGNSAGVDEIISDVEFRMAELLRERLMAREVVNVSDIDYLIEIMGLPEDYYTEEFLDEDQREQQSSYKSQHKNSGSQRKKLFRDPDDKMLGGVCSGLGHYFGVDTVWIRLILILLPILDVMFLGISTSSVIIVYIILWIVVPEAKTTSDKLQMRGEAVNFDSIKDFFGNSPEVVRDNLNDLNRDARRVANQSKSILGTLFRFMLKILMIIVIIVLILLAFTLLSSFIATIFGLSVAGLGIGISGVAYGDQLSYLFEDGWEKITAFISLGLLVIIPAITLILIAMRLISSRYRVPKYIAFSLPMLWFLGLIGLVIVATSTAIQFKYIGKEIQTINIPTDASTIVLQRENYSHYADDLDDFFNVKEGYLAIPLDDDLEIKPSATGNSYLELEYKSRGISKSQANDYINQTQYDYTINDSVVTLDGNLYIKQGHKWRNQYVKPTLYLSADKNLSLRNFDDLSVEENGINTWYSANSKNIYTFDNNLFQCVNCPSDEDAIDEEKVTITNNGVLDSTSLGDSITIKNQNNDSGNNNIHNRNDSISD